MPDNCYNPFDPLDGQNLASTFYTGNGSSTTYPLSFGYLGQDAWVSSDYSSYSVTCNANIAVIVDGTLTSYKMPNNYSVQFQTAPTDGAEIEIRRTSGISARKVDYVGGSVVTESNLDRDGDQAHYLIQELADRMNDAVCQINSSRNINSYYFDSVNGVQTVFALNYAASSNTSEETSLLNANELLVLFNAAGQQSRATNYTTSLISGVLNVTFASAPALNTNIEIRTLASGISQRVNIQDGDIDTDAIQDGAVTWDKVDLDGAGSDNTFLGQRSGVATWDQITTSDILNLLTYIRANKVTDLAVPTTNFSMNSNKITNLATPTNSGDAVNKSYADALVAGTGVANQYIEKITLVQGTPVSVTVPFTPDFVEICVDGDSSSGSTISLGAGNTASYPHTKFIAYADLGSAVNWTFKVTSGGSPYQVQVTAAGDVITFKHINLASFSTTTSLFVRFHANA